MNKNSKHAFENLFVSGLYIILAFSICTYVIGTSLLKTILLVACILYGMLIMVYNVKKKKDIDVSEAVEVYHRLR